MVFQEQLIRSLRANAKGTAIEISEMRISYAELLQQADKITRYLLNRKVERGTIVGVLLKDREKLIYTIIGIANAGCVFVPIDVSLPGSRLMEILTDLNPGYIISSGEFPKSDPNQTATMQYLSLSDIMDTDDDLPLFYPVCDKNDALYIYFTSGSTGKPKGIVGKNSSLAQFIQWEIGEFQIDNNTRVSQLISPYFDAFLRDIFVPLMAGGTICLAPEEEDFYSPDKIISWLDRKGINLVHCVPSVFRNINIDTLTTTNFSALRYVLLSGEKIIPAELTNWYRVFGERIQLVNLYGPTETTMVRTFYRIKPGDTRQVRIPVGLPIADTEILIAGKDLKPCGTLVSGEVYIITAYATKGYLNDPELTHERFIRQYPEKGDETIAFKTGDIGRRLANGQIDLMGREDRQIKIRGIRVEPGEIESVMIESGYVNNTLVVTHGENGNESLIAFVTRKEGWQEKMDFELVLQEYMTSRLPKYLLPAEIKEIKAFPLLSNGKINQKELMRGLEVKEIIGPANDFEVRLLGIWQLILGNKEVSTDDNFHRIGGNSLAIMKLIGLIHKEFNVRVSLQDLFLNMTITKQAALICRAGKDTIRGISEAPRKSAYHVSVNQAAMLLRHRWRPTDTACNMTITWQLAGPLNKDKMIDAIHQLIQRHAGLRTVFSIQEEGYFQIIEELMEISIEEISCTGEGADLVITAFKRPFDIEIAPLFRWGFITTGAHKTTVVLDMHGSLCDEVSQGKLYNDLVRSYKGEEIPSLPLQYKDFAEWEHNARTTAEFLSQREFWLKRFEKDIPALHIPMPGLYAEERSDNKEIISFSIDCDVIDQLSRSVNLPEVSTHSLFLSAFFICLWQLAHQNDIVIGVKAPGRTQPECRDLVGLFSKILAIRYEVSETMPFDKFILDLHSHFMQADGRQLYDQVDILTELSNRKGVSVNKLFDVFFDYRKDERTMNENLFLTPRGRVPQIDYPAALIAEETDKQYEFQFVYTPGWMSRTAANTLTSLFVSLMQVAAVHPGDTLQTIVENSRHTQENMLPV